MWFFDCLCILASFSGSPERKIYTRTESFLTWSWRNQNKTRVFRTERQHFTCYSTNYTFNARCVWYSLPDSYIRVESFLLPPLFFLFWVFRYAHVQLRSFYHLSTFEGSQVRKNTTACMYRRFSRDKKDQALSACINSISRSGAEQPGNEATCICSRAPPLSHPHHMISVPRPSPFFTALV